MSEAKKWVKSVLSWYIIVYDSDYSRLSSDICEFLLFDEILEYTWISFETLHLWCVIVYEVNLSILLTLNLKRPHNPITASGIAKNHESRVYLLNSVVFFFLPFQLSIVQYALYTPHVFLGLFISTISASEKH